MRFHRHYLRRWAAVVLLAWVFGIVMSVANACAIQPPASTHASAVAVEHATASSHHHDSDGESDEAAKANCLDFCDESSVAAATWQPLADSANFAWLPAILIALVLPQPQLQAARSVLSTPAHTGAPPIPIAFLRLAL